jgi:type IV pilus assembly protein PilY1
VARLQNSQTSTLWLFFGTGRYFYNVTTTPDDNESTRHIFGIKEPCFVADALTKKGRYEDSCPSPLSGVGSPLTNVTNVADVTSSPDDPDFKGWYIRLDPLDNAHSLGAERAKSDPVALTSGLVLFTTLKPYNAVNPCLIGGQSLLWAVKYNTGDAGGALLKGKAIVQLSTGAIEQVDMAAAFNDPGTGNRRTSTAMEGIAPGGISVITSPPPVKKVVHIRER